MINKQIDASLFILSLLPSLAFASSTLPSDFFYKVYLIEFIFVVLGLLTSQFLPLEKGYSSVGQRIAFGVGGVLLGLVSAGLILRFGIIKI